AAVHRWEAVLDAQPENLEAQAELGRAWATVGDREQSLVHYKTAITGYLKSSDKNEVVSRFMEVIGFFPDFVLESPEQFSMARALEEQGKYEAAEAALSALIER